MNSTELENSLPSNSTFVDAGESVDFRNQRTSILPTHEEYYDDDQFDDDDGSDRSPSPPPPPPPPISNYQAIEETSLPKPQPVPNNPSKPKFPFLKKNSRREPSALNRMNSPKASPEKEATKQSGFQETTRPHTNELNNNYMDYTESTNGSKMEESEPMDDMQLSGRSRFNTHSTTSTTIGHSQNIFSNGRESIDRLAQTTYTEQSTVNITGEEWKQQQSAAADELQEFELIEKQLESSSILRATPTLSGFTDVPRDVSSFNKSRQQQDRPVVMESLRESVESDGWGDAYKLDNYTSTTTQLKTTTSYNTTNMNNNTTRSIEGENEVSEFDEYGYTYQDFIDHNHDGADSDQDLNLGNTMKMSGSNWKAPATRPSLSATTTSTAATGSGAADVEHEDSDYDDHIDRSPSPNSGATARLPSSSASDLRSTARHNSSESPSWGRVTQPNTDTFDEDTQDAEYSSADAPRSNTSGVSHESNFTSTTRARRMSDSALRKISSRTAALHQGTQSRIERPILADDTNTTQRQPQATSVSTGERSETSKEVVHTRPLSMQQRLASTTNSAIGGKQRSNSVGGRLSRTPASQQSEGELTQAALVEKAKELETELQTYRTETANLKKLRKQQEMALAEVVHQKEEVMRWVAEEKARTTKWCEEQQLIANKERNTAAKLARDSRQKALSGAVPIRKEKAEMEALQATIEKMKVDHEQAAKKWKLTENRLYALIKEHTGHIESSEKQLLALEHEKLQLLEFIGEQGLRLPKTLRSTLQRTPLYRSTTGTGSSTTGNSGSNGGTVRTTAMDVLHGRSPHTREQQRGLYGDVGYAEEVDVDCADVTTNTVYTNATTTGCSMLDMPKKSPTQPKIQDGSSRNSASNQQAGEVFNRLSSNLRSTSTPRSTSRSNSSGNRNSTGAGSLSRTMNHNNTSIGRSSWARSSRSSVASSTAGSASRYDDFEASDRDELGEGYSAIEIESKGSNTKINMSNTLSNTAKPSLKQEDMGTTTALSATTTNHTTTGEANRTEEILPNGSKIVRYKNGTEKQIDPKGNSTVRFLNGDTKSVDVTAGTVVYYYREADTTHTTFQDGLEVYEFPNKQVEMHFPDGIKEIIFPDSTRKVIHPDGLQESHFPDGVILKEHPDGRREVLSSDTV